MNQRNTFQTLQARRSRIAAATISLRRETTALAIPIGFCSCRQHQVRQRRPQQLPLHSRRPQRRQLLHIHTDAHPNGYVYADSDSYIHANPNGYSYCYFYTNAYGDGHSYIHAYTNSHSYSHTDAQPLLLVW